MQAARSPVPRVLRLLVLLASSAVVLYLSPAVIRACSCIPPEPPLEALAKVDAVFIGRVIDADGPYPVPVRSDAYRESDRWFRFLVLSSWKGAERDTVVVRTGAGGGDCGYDFRLGETYFVYAYRGRRGKEGDTLSTSICDRTRPVLAGAEDSIALGSPQVDRTTGRVWRSIRVGMPCPVHGGHEITNGYAFIQFGAPDVLVNAFRQRADKDFPYAGIQFDRPRWDVGAAEFRGINRALICRLCQGKAREWLCQQGARCQGFAPETEQDDERRARLPSEKDYRDDHPMKGFAFFYDDGRELIVDTIEGTLIRRIPGERNQKVMCEWTQPELQRIYDRMMTIRFFDLPTPHPTYYRPEGLRDVGESADVQLFARSDTTVHQLRWDAAYATKDQESMVSDWQRLYALIDLIRGTLESKPEYVSLFKK